MEIPTKRVVMRASGGEVLINAADYDVTLHEELPPITGRLRMPDGRTLPTTSGECSWDLLRAIGGGGQGDIFLARRAMWEPEAALKAYLPVLLGVATSSALRDEARWQRAESWVEQTARLLEEAIQHYAQPVEHVLKLFQPRDNAAWARSDEEYRILRKFRSPGIVEVVDHGEAADRQRTRWTVYRRYARGAITEHFDHYKGDALACLKAIAALLKPLRALHEQGITHRDIKPDNIFIADSGELILGDFGLVRDESAELSLTATGEKNVGAWQFMPHVWREMEPSRDYDYAFDLYALAKTLWCLAAGQSYLPREAFADAEYNLAQRWPSNHGMEALYRIFPKILVDRREKVAYKSTSETQADVDAIIVELEHRLTAAGQQPDKCASCQTGRYERSGVPAGLVPERFTGLNGSTVVERIEAWRCSACGHVRLYMPAPRPPA